MNETIRYMLRHADVLLLAAEINERYLQRGGREAFIPRLDGDTLGDLGEAIKLMEGKVKWLRRAMGRELTDKQRAQFGKSLTDAEFVLAVLCKVRVLMQVIEQEMAVQMQRLRDRHQREIAYYRALCDEKDRFLAEALMQEHGQVRQLKDLKEDTILEIVKNAIP